MGLTVQLSQSLASPWGWTTALDFDVYAVYREK